MISRHCIKPGYSPLPSPFNEKITVSIHPHCSVVYLCQKSYEPHHDPPVELTYSASPLNEKTPIPSPKPDIIPSVCKNDTLFRAASRGFAEKIRDLIHNGADANAEQNGTTLLIKSAMCGTASVTETLLGMEDIKVNCQNHARQSALWCAAHRGYSKVVELLLEKEDIQIDCKDESGLTPLAIAAVGGHTEVVELLLAKGANTEARDSIWSMTPASWAERVGNVDTVHALRKSPARAPVTVPNWVAKM